MRRRSVPRVRAARKRFRLYRRSCCAAQLVTLVLLLTALPLPAAPLAWIEGFEAGLAEARARQRPAFVYFDAEWCSWCQRYKTGTLADARVREPLARDYVPVRVDFDARADLVARHRIRGLPYTLLLTPGGEVLNGFVGILTPEDMLDILQRFSGRAVPAATMPDSEIRVRATTLDETGYRAFRAAFLEHVDNLYDAESGVLTRRFETGATLKRPSPQTWIYLAGDSAWRERAHRAAQAERTRLLDPVDGGFFNFLDPSLPGGEYLENSKLLESNAWLTAWFALTGADDPGLRAAAGSGWLFLREQLWDHQEGGFWQAQVADQTYYALAPGQRRQATPPPIDRMKRADTNAQASWALVHFVRAGGPRAALDYASGGLDYVLARLWREGRLYHFQRGTTFATPDLPQNWFWVLAAGAALEAERPGASRRERLRQVSRAAAAWLQREMDKPVPEEHGAELLGLIAWVAQERALYPQIPAAARDWALRAMHLRTDTPPDDIVPGLMAWERALGRQAISD